ncbi:CLUMA_CG011186, isoform A [Clunio marinus]|uniref:CLUMA_CG011186, isoform A n=1 Tax=Clunio marinus TaxID=568069 RepID=A0A1J1IDH7_9DIPT|nr:CLUMA_CG011186, isoform A [Clunio marinus]
MLLHVSKLHYLRNSSIPRQLSTALQQQISENAETSEVVYPEILDQSLKARGARKTFEWHEKIKKIGTIEEKIIELNMPKYYGWKCLMLENKFYPYNTFPFFKYVTNTEFHEQPQTARNEKESKQIESYLTLMKSELQEAIEFEIDGYKRDFDIKDLKLTPQDIERAKTSGLVKQLNRILTNFLGADNQHLYEADIDIDPRHDAFWFVGGIDPPKNIVKQRENSAWLKEIADENIDRPFQYIGKPMLSLRHQFPLEPFEDVDFSAMNSLNKNIHSSDEFTMDPRTIGFFTDHRHGTTLPGFWPGNVREYGLITYQDRNVLLGRPETFGEEDNQETLHSVGIISSFAWTYAQACFQGFSTYNDMTYPLVTQTVVTNGQMWSFYKYQLNTTVTHTSPLEPNYRFNKCWGTKEMKLYDEIDEKGKLQGLNEEVLRNLIQFYINEPKERQHEMKPYLDEKEKKIADIEDVKRRDWLEKTFKYIMSNKPRQRLVPEIYAWEKIYKIDHKTRPLDRRLRFFELGINPFARRLNEHQPKYIPRHLRARGPHDRKIWEPTYYPLDNRMNIPREMSHSSFGAPRDKYAYTFDRKRKSYKEKEIRVRFAPSPTGFLHLGGLRTALFNYLFAKARNGKFILRIEDTDQTRLIEGAKEQLYKDLEWAGIIPDEGPAPVYGGNYGPYIQSERLDIYEDYVNKLLENGDAYHCFCSDRRLELLKKDAIKARQIPKYDNRCRDLTPKQIAEKIAKNDKYCIRALGWTPPHYGHLPLIMNADGSKLSKRQNDIKLEYYRSKGIFPQALVNYVTQAGGGFNRKPDEQLYSYEMKELTQLFDVTLINSNSSRLNPELLGKLNKHELLKHLENPITCKQIIDEVRSLIKNKYPLNADQLDLDDDHILNVLKWGSKHITSINELTGENLSFLWVLPKIAKDKEITLNADIIDELVEELKNENFSKQNLQTILKDFSSEKNLTFASFMKNLRSTLSGLKEGPGVAEIMEMLGRDTTLERIIRMKGKKHKNS